MEYLKAINKRFLQIKSGNDQTEENSIHDQEIFSLVVNASFAISLPS
jgi:hypothetical protein